MPNEPFADDGRRDLPAIHTRQDFARELTFLRERAGLTVRDVARIVNIAPATLGGYFGGRHLPPVRQLDQLRLILNACGITDPVVVEQWQHALLRVRRAPGIRPGTAPIPYRGLESFQPEHAEWFFGRERLVDLLLGRLAARCVAGGPLMVVGPSGSGKSSLLRAGMTPALRSGALNVPGAASWPLLFLTPGDRPLHGLANQLSSATGIAASEFVAAVRADPRRAANLARRPPADNDSPEQMSGGEDASRLIIVVDQFEELFTACSDEVERRAFVAALAAAAAGAEGATTAECLPNLVVLGLRADFYDRAVRYPELATALQDGQVVVGPMTETELRRTIVEPARKANLDVEDGLVELLLRDLSPATDTTPQVAHDPGALPLLSHALLETWRRGHRRRLTVADYQEIGGIHGAVARTAENVYEALTPDQQHIARAMFLRLVHVADDVSDTRRRVSRKELALGDADAQLVLDRFVEQRLITADKGHIEISHEALLAAWPRLRGWIDTDRAGLRTHRQLTAAAESWQENGRDAHVLYRGLRLAAVREWMTDSSHRADLSTLEREFFDASIAHEAAELRASKRRGRRQRQFLAALTALSLVAVLLTAYAFRQRATANHERDLAVSRQVATTANEIRSTDVALAAQLALAAYQIAPTVEARSSLLQSFAGPTATRVTARPGVIQSLAISNDGQTMAAGAGDFSLRLWNLADPGRPTQLGKPLSGHPNTIFSAAFSPDGTTLATGGGDNALLLWRTAPGRPATPLGKLTGPAHTVYSVAFSPDGRTLAAGSADQTVRLWDVTDPAAPTPLGQPITGPTGYVQSVAFSPDSRTLAAGSADQTVRLWDVSIPSRSTPLGGPLTGPAKKVLSVAFSPDGRTLAAASADHTIRLWNMSNRDQPVPLGTPLTGPTGWVNSVTFSPDGLALAAGSADEKVWIWDIATRQVTASLPHPAPVTTVLYTNQGHTLASSAADGMIRLWSLPGPVIGGPTEGIFNADFATDGHTLAIASSDNTASMWNIADPNRPLPLGPTLLNAAQTGRSSGAATLSPDGKILAVGAMDGSVQLWDVRDPRNPVALPTRLPAHRDAVQALSFSRNSRILATASNDHTASLWDLTDPRQPARLGLPLTEPTNITYSPAFSPDGRTFAVGTADKKIHLWDITDPSRPFPLSPPLIGPNSYVFTVAFSPDGRTFAAGSADNSIRLWDITDRQHPTLIGAPLIGPDNYIYSIDFSADGRTLAAGAGHGAIWLWDLNDRSRPHTLATLKAHTGSVYIVKFDPKRDLLASGAADKLVRLWDTDPGRVAARICATTGAQLTGDEWARYIPSLRYRAPCQI